MKGALDGKGHFESLILHYMSSSDSLCTEIEIKSQMYRAGQIVVIEQLSLDEMKVGLIVSILLKERSTHFVTKQFFAEREFLQYYRAASDDPPLTIQDVSKLADYKPLVNHGTSSQVFFCLHHHISYTFP